MVRTPAGKKYQAQQYANVRMRPDSSKSRQTKHRRSGPWPKGKVPPHLKKHLFQKVNHAASAKTKSEVQRATATVKRLADKVIRRSGKVRRRATISGSTGPARSYTERRVRRQDRPEYAPEVMNRVRAHEEKSLDSGTHNWKSEISLRHPANGL
jgi:hypothetical protein